ncbi:MAG: ArsR/SmtB family transcription factor [Acidimicrobiales bacterium]
MSVDVDTSPVALLKAVAEPLRWQIIEQLAAEELCVCHLVDTLDVPQPLVSHHLKVLRDAGLVESERHRYWTYYRLRPGVLAELGRSITMLAEHAPPAGDRRRPCC